MTKLLWVLETVCFRLALLVGLCWLLSGCSVSDVYNGSVLPTRGPAAIDGGVTAIDGSAFKLDGFVSADTGEAVIVDTRALGEVNVTFDTQAPFDSRVVLDSTPATCMQQVINNGYASASAACAKPDPANVGYNTSEFTSAEAACQYAINCYAANTCNRYNSQDGGCSDCIFLPWSGLPSPFPWLASIITPYCPSFFK